MNGWQETTLRDVTSLIGDGLHGTPNYDAKGEYYFINGNNLVDGKIVLHGTTKRSSKDEYIKHKKDLSNRTILLSINGTIGNVALYNNEKVFLGKSACYLNIDKNIEKDFIYYILKSSAFQAYISSLATGSTIKNVSLKLVRDYSFNLPSPEEQKSIASILGEIDQKIHLNQRMNETLEAMARALFKSWFVDFDPVRAKAEGRKPEGMDAATAALFPAAFNEDGLPEGWVQGTIKELCQRIESGGTPSRKNSEYWDGGDIPWLTSGEVRKKVVLGTKEKITQLGLEQSSAKVWPPMSTIVAMYGATAGQVTLLASPVSANQACCALIPEEYAQSFVFLKTSQSVETYEGQARGSAQQNLNKSIVSDLKTILPPKGILAAFEEMIEDNIKLVIQNFKEITTLSELRDALLPKLISGELRVDDAAPVRKEAVG